MAAGAMAHLLVIDGIAGWKQAIRRRRFSPGPVQPRGGGPASPPARLAKFQPVLDRMLAKDPAARYASCAELITAVNALAF